jgi:hypothetical protein
MDRINPVDYADSLVQMFERYLKESDSQPDFVLSGDFRDVLLFFAQNPGYEKDLEWLLILQIKYFEKLDIEEFEEKLEAWEEWKFQCEIWQNLMRKRSSEKVRNEILSAR